MAVLDAVTLNARLLDGDRLLVTRDDAGRVLTCIVEFLEDQVPPALFQTYLAHGMIEVPKDGVGYKISREGKKRLKASPRRDDGRR
jgi:hypothetical protein